MFPCQGKTIFVLGQFSSQTARLGANRVKNHRNDDFIRPAICAGASQNSPDATAKTAFALFAAYSSAKTLRNGEFYED